jgi:hypothetical protein
LGRTYEEGKKIQWKDGVRALWCLLKYSISEPAIASLTAPAPPDAGLASRPTGQLPPAK